MSEYEDRQDISELLLRYATAIDRCEWRMLGTVFTEACDVDYGQIGAWQTAEAVVEFMQQAHALAGYTLHRLSNMAITLDGDRAQARTYIDAMIMAGDNRSGVNAIGFYDDEIVRTLDGWRIARRRFTSVYLSTIG